MAPDKPAIKDNRKHKFRNGFVVFGIWTLLGVIFSFSKYVNYLSGESPISIWAAVSSAMPEWYIFAFLSVPLPWLFRRFPIRRDSWFLPVILYLIVSILFSALHTIFSHLLQPDMYPLSFVVSPALKYHVIAHYSFNILVFAGILGFNLVLKYNRKLRERELHTSRLKARLAQSQLEVLRNQIQPHFLFNTLHSIAALMYERPESAHDMMTHLSDLLRLSLDSSGRQQVTLEEENFFLRHYIDIQQTRFGDRLKFSVDIQPETINALVPAFFLQPLVENAIRHGIAPYEIMGRIDIRSRVLNGKLSVQIKDNGPGIEGDLESATGDGVGISNFRERLQQLYGDDQNLTFKNDPEGGLIVNIEIPLRIESRGPKEHMNE
jgi:LytS/YehU family sensor histidine kinase